jgi:hypothetical protein
VLFRNVKGVLLCLFLGNYGNNFVFHLKKEAKLGKETMPVMRLDSVVAKDGWPLVQRTLFLLKSPHLHCYRLYMLLCHSFAGIFK